MNTKQLAVCTLALFGTVAAAQEPRFFYPAPPPDAIDVAMNQPYGSLQMDVYRPKSDKSKGALPALIFFHLGTGPQRSDDFYKAWARVAASKNFVAILPDLHSESFEKDFDAVLAHLSANADAVGIDRDRIAVYGGSGNVYRLLPLLQDPKRTTVKAAVMYYGSANVTEFRRDLPVLLVRAGLDRPPVNKAMTELAASATTQNAPVTLLNYPSGHHGFEMVDDEAATRDVMDRTLEFLRRALAPEYQASIRRGLPEAAAAANVASGNFASAATVYAELVKNKPDDARLRLSYGEALLGASQFAAACSELEKLKGKGLGPRDLGLPAARACMLKGDGDAAIAWLKTIPQQFLPGDVEKEATFASIQNRADFKALFQPGSR